MKKHIVSALSMALCLGLTAGSAVTVFADDTKTIDSLKIAFSPYADSDTITTATEPLEDLLKETLLTKGYDVENVDMTVGTSYTAVQISALFQAATMYCFLMTATFFLPHFATPSTRIPTIPKTGTTAPLRKIQTKCLPTTVPSFSPDQVKKARLCWKK